MKTKTPRVLLALAAAVALAPAARACEMCSIYTATEAKENRPGVYVTYFEQETDFGTLQVDGHKIDNEAGESLRSSIHHLIVGYQINRKLGVQVNVPYLNRRFDRAVEGGLEHGSESGLGDVALVAHWRVFDRLNSETNWSWSLLGGIELPTGDSDLLALEAEEDHGEEGDGHDHEEEASGVHPHDLVQGSGSTDYILGTAFHYGKRRLFADARVQYAVRTTGDFDYRFANETSVELGFGGFAWLNHGRTLALALTLSSERKGKDELAGEAVDDTARRTVYLGPTVSYSHRERFFGELFVDFPIDQESSALQIVPDHRLRIALTGRF